MLLGQHLAVDDEPAVDDVQPALLVLGGQVERSAGGDFHRNVDHRGKDGRRRALAERGSRQQPHRHAGSRDFG